MERRKNNGKGYEAIVAGIIRQFADGATVIKDEFITGKSGVPRQVDVAIHSTIIGLPILVLVECRDYQKKLDITHVDGLIGKIDDLGAHAGFLVSNAGFASGAFNRSRQDGRIYLKSVFDAKNNALRALPIVNFIVGVNELAAKYHLLDSEGNHRRLLPEQDHLLAEVLHQGIEQAIPDRPPGTHELVCKVRIENGLEMDLKFTVEITRTLYSKRLGIGDGSGIVNHHKPCENSVQARGAFATESIPLNQVRETWKVLAPGNMPNHFIMLEFFISGSVK